MDQQMCRRTGTGVPVAIGRSVRGLVASALLFVFATITPQAMSSAEEGTMHENEIKAVVEDYVAGWHGSGPESRERLERAFQADNATMAGQLKADDGALEVRTWTDMNVLIDGWSSTETDGEPTSEILNLAIVDNRLASVLLRFSDTYYDSLTLMRIDGQWKIVAKVFVEQ